MFWMGTRNIYLRLTFCPALRITSNIKINHRMYILDFNMLCFCFKHTRRRLVKQESEYMQEKKAFHWLFDTKNMCNTPDIDMKYSSIPVHSFNSPLGREKNSICEMLCVCIWGIARIVEWFSAEHQHPYAAAFEFSSRILTRHTHNLHTHIQRNAAMPTQSESTWTTE